MTTKVKQQQAFLTAIPKAINSMIQQTVDHIKQKVQHRHRTVHQHVKAKLNPSEISHLPDILLCPVTIWLPAWKHSLLYSRLVTLKEGLQKFAKVILPGKPYGTSVNWKTNSSAYMYRQ
ncbi:hypothetical protein [Bacillus subtilis]|uniref:hypothetical protein n=1 Tax=Bacillus subtilis TaxID=1423 RepID=UPI00293024C3|nr:hypothetical protein [Bacillus subtilis]WOA23155.1 hypothetical protein RW107_03980 [Bacillus subtilis]